MEKLIEILELENAYNIKLEMLEVDSFFLGNEKILNTYAVNKEGVITHLCLTGKYIYDTSNLQNFSDLEYLCLINTSIEHLEDLEHIVNLRTLIIRDSNIFEVNNLEYLPKLEELNLSRNQITEVNNLGILNNLIKIDFSDNELDYIEGFDDLEVLKELNLSHNSISYIYGLDHLKLERLDLSYNQIVNIENIEVHKSLQYLNLANNQIIEIKNLEVHDLKSLDLSYNNITKIERLSKLVLLENLKLNNNKISRLENLENLENLKSLEVGFNIITEIEGLNNLTKLKLLYLSANKIKSIQGLDNLQNLESLFLGFNEITILENFNKLNNLSNLAIYNNKISTIGTIHKDLKIQFLNLASNNLANIEFIIKFNNLRSLDISENRISEIKDIEIIGKIKNLTNLRINENPFLEKSQIILKQNENHYDIIINEIRKYQATKIQIALPLKICLLGNHSSGKSTFLNYFFDNQTNNQVSTHILEIRAFKEGKTEIPEAIFYDFGGQDYYHGIYKAFLTQASTNLLFWNKKTDTNNLSIDSKGQKNINFNRKYWLGQINYVEELEGDNSNNKNIYQIQTHSELYAQEILEHDNTVRFIYLSFDEKSLQKNSYKLILDGFKEELLEVIKNRPKKEISIDEYELYKFIVNNKKKNEINIKELLIHYNKKENEVNLLQAELDQLSKKGLILYYKNCKNLNEVVWLQPAKTVAEIYKIFNENILRKYNGEIPKDIFEKKIKNANLLELLKYNKVIFLDDKSRPSRYIIPGYLRSTTDENDDYFIFGDFNKFNFILKFESFIPFGFINQLICKYGGAYEAKSFRKDQLIFTTEARDIKISIKLDFKRLLIKVGVISKAENKIAHIENQIFQDILFTYWGIGLKSEYVDINYNTTIHKKKFFSENEIADLESIKYVNVNFKTKRRSYIKELHKSMLFQDVLPIKKMIPEDMYLSIDGKNFVHYNTLENEELVTTHISSYELKEDGSLIKKENSISTINFKNFSNNKNIKNMKKIFISYSHVNFKEKERLMTFLKPLERTGQINIWQDLKLQAGEKVKKEIIDKLDEADVVIMLISQDFISSDFIYDVELQNAMKKKLSDKIKILPVLISECTIFDLDLNVKSDDNDNEEKVMMGDYYFVPQDESNNLKAIKMWGEHQDSAWKKVYDSLKELIK